MKRKLILLTIMLILIAGVIAYDVPYDDWDFDNYYELINASNLSGNHVYANSTLSVGGITDPLACRGASDGTYYNWECSQNVTYNVSILPGANNTESIGSADRLWKKGYFVDLFVHIITGLSDIIVNSNFEMNNTNITNINTMIFNTSGCTDDTTEGLVCWNADQQTLNVVTGLGNVYQVGQELTGVGKNIQGDIIYAGDVVYLVGSQGEMPTIALANASNGTKFHSPAVVTIPFCNDNAICPVTTFGYVHDLDTSMWTEGDKLYLTPYGNMSNETTNYPDYNIEMGIVTRVHASSGIVLVLPEIDIGDGVVVKSLSVINDTFIGGDLNVSGNFTGNQIYGEMWNYTSADDPWEFNIDAADIYYNLTNMTAGELNGFTFTRGDPERGSYLTAQVEGMYHANFAISFLSENVGGLYSAAIVQNYDVTMHRDCYSRRAAATAVGNMGVVCIIDLNKGDNVSIQVENENTNRDMIIHSVNINLVRIGDLIG